MNSFIFWDITPRSPKQSFHAGFLLDLFFEPNEGGDMFL
jgi:hypothetical protein